MWSRRTERALACLAGILLLTHTASVSGAAQPRPSAASSDRAAPAQTIHIDTVGDDASPTEVRFLLRAASPINDRIIATTRDALGRLLAWFGPVAGGRVTIEDVPWASDRTAGDAGTVVISSRWLQPERDLSLERALISGLARLPFAAFTADADVTRVFVDGLWRYTAVRTINESLDGRHFLSMRVFGGFVPYTMRSIVLWRRAWDPRPRLWRSPQSGLSFAEERGAPPPAAQARRAEETMMALLSLERVIGWPALQQGLAALVERFRGRSPRAADLIAILEEQRGARLPVGLAAAVDRPGAADVAVAGLTSAPAANGSYLTVVRVRASFPDDGPAGAGPPLELPLTLYFEDGSVVRDALKSNAGEVTFEYASPARARQARVDPDSMLLLDRDRSDNTRSLQTRLAPAAMRHLLNWLIWLQDLALTGAALV